MSLLIVEPTAGPGLEIARYLIEEGDEVRVVVTDHADRTAFEEIGAYVAVGDPGDDDLIERACQNVRTVILHDPPLKRLVPVLPDIVRGARRAGVDRMILAAERPLQVADVFDKDAMSYVVMTTRGRGLRTRRVPVRDLAEAISAADDLAGEPHLAVDLSTSEGWQDLRLSPR